MQVNRVNNVNFYGKVNTDAIKVFENLSKAAEKSPFLKKFAAGMPEGKNLYVYASHRHASRTEVICQGRDDDLYRMTFGFKERAKTLFGRIFDFFFAKKIMLTSKFHSESTVSELLQNEGYLSELFAKYLKK